MFRNIKLYFEIFIIFFKIGAFTFGGGVAMLPIIQREIIEKRKWIKEEEFIDIMAISQSIPGVIAVKASFFIGKKAFGTKAGIFGALGVVLPSFVAILSIIGVLSILEDNIYVDKVLSGVRASSTALILLAGIKMAQKTIKGKLDWILSIGSFLVIMFWGINPAWAIIVGGILGYIMYRIKKVEINV